MSRQQIPVVCYDKNHYIYPANLLVISRLAKLLMHRTIGVIYGLMLAQLFPVPPCFPDATVSLKSCSCLPETLSRMYDPSSLFRRSFYGLPVNKHRDMMTVPTEMPIFEPELIPCPIT